jgi:hypothetical protein
VYFLLSSFVFAASHLRLCSSPAVLYVLGDLCVQSASLSFVSSTSFSSHNSFSLTFLADTHPLTSLESDSYKNIGGRRLSVLLIKNSALTLESLLARSRALFERSFHSFNKECSRTLLQPTRSALFFKTAGCIGFLPILVHPEPAAAGEGNSSLACPRRTAFLPRRTVLRGMPYSLRMISRSRALAGHARTHSRLALLSLKGRLARY